MKTGHRPAPPRCALASAIPVQRDAEQLKRKAWVEQGILVVSANDTRLDFVEKELVHRIGEALYGVR